MAFQNSIMPMMSTMPGSISGSRLTPSSTFFTGPLPFLTTSTTAVPITEHMVAEETARKMLLRIALKLFSVEKSSA